MKQEEQLNENVTIEECNNRSPRGSNRTRTVSLFNMKDGSLIKTYRSVADAARDYGYSRINIAKVCRKNADSTKNYSYKGYVWRYIDKEAADGQEENVL